MTRNESNTDRTIRALLGIVFLAAWFLGWTQGVLAVILGVVGIILLPTAAIGFCPLYRLFGISTCPVKQS